MFVSDTYNEFIAQKSNSLVVPLRSLRIKITDRCSWNCWWCHNEGSGKRNPKLVGDIEWNDELVEILEWFKNNLNFNEIHLTGGEPTVHPSLPFIVAKMKGLGFHVKATSIGCPPESLKRLVDSGIDGINFSLHALDYNLFHTTQINRSLNWAEKQLTQQLDAILLAKNLGLKVKLNTVIAYQKDISRVVSVIEWSKSNNIAVCLLPELGDASLSIETIKHLCEQLSAVEISRKYTFASSNSTILYHLPDGYELTVKFISDVFLSKTMCRQCTFKNTKLCTEKFYGIRLEKRLVNKQWGLYIRLCLHRTTNETYLPITHFLTSKQLTEIQSMLK